MPPRFSARGKNLLVVGAVEEGRDLAAHAVSFRHEQPVANALGHTIERRPDSRIREVAVSRDVAELRRAGLLRV